MDLGLTVLSWMARRILLKSLFGRPSHGGLRSLPGCAQLARALPFLPAELLAGWLGAMVFVLALALFAWAIVTITKAGSNVPTSLRTTTVVETGPYRFTRNPIYLGMFLGLIGLAIAFNSLWLLLTLVPFALVIRYGVVARKEAYLDRKFGHVYRRYRARVRRWMYRTRHEASCKTAGRCRFTGWIACNGPYQSGRTGA